MSTVWTPMINNHASLKSDGRSTGGSTPCNDPLNWATVETEWSLDAVDTQPSFTG